MNTTHILKTTVCGTVAGLLLGVLSGGLWSALFGQPFSGATGLKVFHLGMFFPGLVIVAPVTAGIGAVCGATASWMRRKKGSRADPARRGKCIFLVLATPIVADCTIAVLLALSDGLQSVHWYASVLMLKDKMSRST